MKLPLSILCLLLCLVAACEMQSDGNAQDAMADSLQAAGQGEEEDEEEPDFIAYLTGALTDTLDGDARFGEIYQITAKDSDLVIELEAGADFTGGMFITMADTALPQAGQYNLGAPSEGDTTIQARPYRIVYRRGLILDLEAVDGTLTLDTVTDTLITGSFEALMRGDVPVPTGGIQQGEVRARGEFKARPGTVGYIVGIQ